ncbi:MAG: hypothetical protein WB729_04600 [Candidatus Sulfotelmatobacter sp.]
MKLLGVIGTAVLSLTVGATALAYPQQEQRDQPDEKEKSAHQHEKKAQPEKPAKQEEKASPARNENAKPEERPAHQQPERTQQAKPQQHEQHAGGGDHGGRIPDDRYKAHFGREHTFRVSQGDYSNRRFQYGGYWFGFAGVWPSNWLYTQDVYVVEINGVYYLCNPSYPGVNVELIVTL